MINELIAGWIKSAKMSAFYLIIFVSTSVSWQDFDAFRLTISLSISPFTTMENLNKLFSLESFSIAFTLRWSSYFKIGFKAGSLILLEIG